MVLREATRTAEGYGLRADHGTDEGRFAVRRGTMTAALDPSAADCRTGCPTARRPGDLNRDRPPHPLRTDQSARPRAAPDQPDPARPGGPARAFDRPPPCAADPGGHRDRAIGRSDLGRPGQPGRRADDPDRRSTRRRAGRGRPGRPIAVRPGRARPRRGRPRPAPSPIGVARGRRAAARALRPWRPAGQNVAGRGRSAGDVGADAPARRRATPADARGDHPGDRRNPYGHGPPGRRRRRSPRPLGHGPGREHRPCPAPGTDGLARWRPPGAGCVERRGGPARPDGERRLDPWRPLAGQRARDGRRRGDRRDRRLGQCRG